MYGVTSHTIPASNNWNYFSTLLLPLVSLNVVLRSLESLTLFWRSRIVKCFVYSCQMVKCFHWTASRVCSILHFATGHWLGQWHCPRRFVQFLFCILSPFSLPAVVTFWVLTSLGVWPEISYSSCLKVLDMILSLSSFCTMWCVPAMTNCGFLWQGYSSLSEFVVSQDSFMMSSSFHQFVR